MLLSRVKLRMSASGRFETFSPTPKLTSLTVTLGPKVAVKER